jgi:small-conductance mechanosensitive channel
MNTMDNPNKFILPERNPITHTKHRREVFWQILLPMLIGVLLILFVVFIVVFTGPQSSSDLSRWANVSTIWLILPSLFFALIFLIILSAFIYLSTVVLRITPRYAHLIQLYFEIGKGKVSQITDLIVKPFVKTRSTWAVLRQVGSLGKQPPGDR